MKYSVKDILRIEVAPALGCTEPVAIALAAAAARSILPDDTCESIELWVDPNIYKNGIAVSIPNTDGLTGLDTAAALGALGGDPALRLEVLASVDNQAVKAARALLAAGKVKVNLLADQQGIYVRTAIKGKSHTAEAVIVKVHDNIVSLSLDGEAVEDSPLVNPGAVDGQTRTDLSDLEEWLRQLSLEQLLTLIDDLDDTDRAFLQDGIDINLRLAEYGLKHGCGLGVGKALERLVRQRFIKRGMMTEARILTSAAADARMAGVNMPAMSSAGSGNHGLTAILPITAVKEYAQINPGTLIEAIAVSHIITAYIKAYTGRLSAVCGCSVAAGAGATAGIAYLLGGDRHHIAGAIKNLITDLAGVICDGAKAGCALKLATAAATSVQAALFALQGVNVQSTDGIIGASPEDTMKNIGTLTTEGMIATDRTILNIMLQKQFTDEP